MLKTCLRFDTRSAFFAELVFAIVARILPETSRARNLGMGYDTHMIGFLEGDVRQTGEGCALVVVGGIGYIVALTKETRSSLRLGERATLFTHLAVREDALDLYGFQNELELSFFKLLLSVSGIGPKSALAIMDIASVDTLRSAIASGNAGYLTTVSGVGKKTAEKIVFELKDKLGALSMEIPTALRGDEEALEAMRSLGYSVAEARDALRKVPHTIEGGSARLREALKLLGSAGS